MCRNNHMINSLLIILVACIPYNLQAQKPFRVGTTAANFLEIGYGAAGCSMGDAYVSMARGLSAMMTPAACVPQLRTMPSITVPSS